MTGSNEGTEHYVSREDGGVYYYKVGQGEPLIFLHAVGLSGWTWRKVIDRFAEHFCCYNIDLPGFDHSDVPPRKYSIEDFSKAFVDVLDDSAIDKANIVADHTGSMVAVDMAGSYPQRVKRMVLDGLPYWDKERGTAYFESHFEPFFTKVPSYDSPVPPPMTFEEAQEQFPGMDYETWKRREEIKGKSPLWLRFCQEANTTYDVEEAGPKVKAPTLLIYTDSEMDRFGGALANKGIGGSILKVFPSRGWGGAHEHAPEEFSKVAIEFLFGSQ